MRAQQVFTLAALALLMVGCADDYSPSVICHNANCVEPTNPEEDSTRATLEESLVITDDNGRPLIDGMEIDTFWWGEEGRCLMAHDLDHPERAVDAMEAIALVNDVLTSRAAANLPLTRAAERYTVLIELKGHVGPSKAEAHSPEQLAEHAACAVEMGAELVRAANEYDYGVEVVFMSFTPELLQALFDEPDYQVLRDQGHPVRLTALQGIPRPLDSQTRELDLFPDDIGIDMASVHPHWTRDPVLQGIESRGWELGFWMFNIVPETLRAIEVHRPGYITTSQAASLVSWLER